MESRFAIFNRKFMRIWHNVQFGGGKMDITLERILSLIPRKENGDFKHGAKKNFAESIGLKSGNLISDWLSGNSQSYKNYVYEISAKYGVSVEWLRGETDEKEKPALGESELDNKIINLLCQLSKEELEKVDAFVQGILASR